MSHRKLISFVVLLALASGGDPFSGKKVLEGGIPGRFRLADCRVRTSCWRGFLLTALHFEKGMRRKASEEFRVSNPSLQFAGRQHLELFS